MSEEYIQTAVEIVSAYVSHNNIPAGELPSFITTVHGQLVQLGNKKVEVETPQLVPAVPIKKSVTHDYLISLEDGRRFRTLRRYLSLKGMTPDEYRTKWGLPKDYPMVAKAYAERRSEVAKAIGLGQPKKAAPAPERNLKPKATKKPRKAKAA